MENTIFKCDHHKKNKNKLVCNKCEDKGYSKCVQKCDICLENMTKRCEHTDEQRCITGFWGTPEVNKAIEKDIK
jgi:hypothetical protein